MKTIYVMCGLIGSGKSTWAKVILMTQDDTISISRDGFRNMIKGDGTYHYNGLTEPLIKALRSTGMQLGADFGFNVIVDETHLTKKMRAAVIQEIKTWMTPVRIVCVYCTESIRNVDFRMTHSRGRSREEWQKVYDDMKAVFEPPTEDEGFDEIVIHRIAD